MTPTNYFDYLAGEKLTDIVADRGFLDLIYTALFDSETETKLIVSGDIPFIFTEIL